MYQQEIQRIVRQKWSQYEDGVDRLAQEIVNVFSPDRKVNHRERLDVRMILPDSDTSGMVTLCAKKNNAPTDSPAISLAICEGSAIKLGSDDPITSFSSLSVKWAKATANWTNAAGNASYVDCNKATDSSGTLGTGTVRVYLPRSAGMDPNVRSGETIAYFLDANGTAVACGAYLDDKIGTVKMWAGASGSVPGGWAIMNGSQGGSGLNANGRFLEGITSGSVGVAAASGTSASGTTGISVAAHAKADVAGSISVDAHTGSAVAGVLDNHTGTLTTDGPSGTETVDKNGDGVTIAVASADHTHGGDIQTLSHTGTGSLTHTVSASGGSDLSHSVTDSGHTHGPGTLEPQSIQLFFIERVS